MKPKLLVLHGKKYFDMPTWAETDTVRERFDVKKSQVLRGKPDIIYCQAFLQCRRELRRWDGPCVIPIGGYPWEFGGNRTKMISELLTQNRGRVVLFMSRWLEEEFGRRKMDVGRGALITHLPRGHWGMDNAISGVQPGRFVEKEDYSLGKPPTVIMSINLSTGKWRGWKIAGIPLMLEAMRPVARAHGVKFVCAGIRMDNFPYLEKWGRLYNFHSVRSHYKHDKTDRWPAMLRSADIFVHPSMYDGWGRAVADAMCTAVPSVILNATSPPEIGDSLVVHDPGDAEGMASTLKELLGSKKRRRELGKAQREEALRLTEKHRGDLADVLEMALDRGGAW